MKELNTCLNAKALDLLGSLIGKTTIKYRHDEFFLEKGMIIGNAELFVEDKVYAITNYIHEAPFFWGNEDICDLNFQGISEEEAKSFCLDTKQIDFPLNRTITNIVLVNDKVEELENGNQIFSYKFTRAIIFVFEDLELCFEKETWMSEFIIVMKGSNLIDKLKPADYHLSEWAENQTSRASREIIHLGTSKA